MVILALLYPPPGHCARRRKEEQTREDVERRHPVMNLRRLSEGCRYSTATAGMCLPATHPWCPKDRVFKKEKRRRQSRKVSFCAFLDSATPIDISTLSFGPLSRLPSSPHLVFLNVSKPRTHSGVLYNCTTTICFNICKYAC